MHCLVEVAFLFFFGHPVHTNVDVIEVVYAHFSEMFAKTK